MVEVEVEVEVWRGAARARCCTYMSSAKGRISPTCRRCDALLVERTSKPVRCDYGAKVGGGRLGVGK